MRRVAFRLLVMVTLTIVVAAVVRAWTADEKAALEDLELYSSPHAVFSAFREARKNGDWPTLFSCHTPQAKRYLVREAVFCCSMKEYEPKWRAVMSEYVPKYVIYIEYNKRHREKYGVVYDPNAAETVAEAMKMDALRPWEGEADAVAVEDSVQPDPLPARDEELYWEVVLAQVGDKAAFFKAVMELLGEEPPIETFDDVVIQGDKATVHYTFTAMSHIYQKKPEDEPTEVWETVRRTVHFRRLERGWFIDRIGS